MTRGSKDRRPSPATIAAGREALRKWQRRRHLLPKCGAKAKTTDEPCRQTAMANGRCAYHGGLTPKGDQWHKKQWRKSASPKDQERQRWTAERREKARAERVSAMTPEERRRYQEWHNARAPGSAARRAAVREERRQHEEARALLARARPADKDAGDDVLEEAIALARRQVELIEAAERERKFLEELFR